MALSAVTTWEVRTAGSDTACSGGFVTGASGTDYSQQDAAQFSGTNLASANGTTNPPQVTSATHNFVAADVGNIIQITAGTNWTAGFYQIVSCAANAATLDRACGTAASISGGTWCEGGALAAPGIASGAKAQGNDVWIKAGTYTISSSTENIATGKVKEIFGTGGGVDGANFSRWEGYQSLRNDKGTKPILKVAAAGVTAIIVFHSEAQSLIVDNIEIDGNSKTDITALSFDNFYNYALRL